MGTRRLMTGMLLLGTLAATPAVAQEARQRRPDSERQRGRQDDSRSRRGDEASSQRAPESRAVERDRRDDRDQRDDRRRDEARRDDGRRDDSRRDDARRNDWRRDDGRRDEARRVDGRRRYYYNPYRRAYVPRTVFAPRFIRPRVVTIVPWRPYIYRPSIGLGIYYGADGAYPYGYTPEGYYDPIPGRVYGGVRIVDAPRDAQVFADGYYVGIVDDFDGVFQHMNLEPGEHHIEIQVSGEEPLAFDVTVQPGQTITLRAGE
jgi:hypothetical protein